MEIKTLRVKVSPSKKKKNRKRAAAQLDDVDEEFEDDDISLTSKVIKMNVLLVLLLNFMHNWIITIELTEINTFCISFLSIANNFLSISFILRLLGYNIKCLRIYTKQKYWKR